MTKETEALSKKIQQAKGLDLQEDSMTKTSSVSSGYQIITEVIVNLLGCILVGISLGVFSDNIFETGKQFTVMLTVLGGVAGIWSVVKYAMTLDKGLKN